MFIVIEGVTCSGKSTLMDKLEYLMGLDTAVERLHKERPQEHTRRWVLTDYVLEYEGYVPNSPISILSDRWHYGEATYAPLYRPETNKDGFGLLGKSGWRWTELFLMSRGVLVIRMDALDEILVQRLADRGDDHVQDPAELLELAERYREVEQYSPSTEITIDTSTDDVVDLDAIWFKALQVEAAAAEILEITPEYVGNPRPDVLLVGDERNITKAHGKETMLPFMPIDSSSGIFLLESLPDDLWEHCGIVNGNDMTGDLRDLWEALGRPRPVALGKKAESALVAAGFAPAEFTRLSHPAYVRRFEHSAQLKYGADIAEAATQKGVYA